MDDSFDLDDDGTSESEVDQQFFQLTKLLQIPRYNECLVCFLVRATPMLEPAGFAMTRIFRSTNAPRATNLGERLSQLGIYGDAQLLQAGVVANSTIWEVERCADCGIPLGAPDCFGVRKGSTQPCQLWIWRKHVVGQRYGDWLDRRY